MSSSSSLIYLVEHLSTVKRTESQGTISSKTIWRHCGIHLGIKIGSSALPPPSSFLNPHSSVSLWRGSEVNLLNFPFKFDLFLLHIGGAVCRYWMIENKIVWIVFHKLSLRSIQDRFQLIWKLFVGIFWLFMIDFHCLRLRFNFAAILLDPLQFGRHRVLLWRGVGWPQPSSRLSGITTSAFLWTRKHK